MWSTPTKRRFVDLLAVTTVAIYALIVTGSVVATTGAASGCSTWPVCDDIFVYPTSVESVLVLGHRLLAVVVGSLLLGTVVFAWTTDVSRRVRLLVTGGGALFPVQAGIGAAVVLTDSWFASRLHLVVAAGIFAALLLALGWALEEPRSTGAGTDTLPVGVGSVATKRSARPVDASEPERPASEPEPAVTSAQPSDEPNPPDLSPPDHPNRWTRIARIAGAYVELTKPRLLWLLCLLALAGMALATTTGTWPDGSTVVATLAGGVLAVGASGTFNHVFERDRDRKMARTADRPVATNRVSKTRALLFGFALVVSSQLLMLAFVNGLAAVLTLIAVVYYSVLYTVVLKPNTSWNVAIGGVAGALPAVIGWAAVTGGIGLPALALAVVVVFWTPAHFYNLAIAYRDDYARAGYPMYPVVAGVSAARRRIVTALGVTLLATALLGYVAPLGVVFAASTTVVGAIFLASVVSQCRVRTRSATLRSFYASNAYLGVLLVAIVAETVLAAL